MSYIEVKKYCLAGSLKVAPSLLIKDLSHLYSVFVFLHFKMKYPLMSFNVYF